MSTFTPAETAACCRLIELALREDFGESPWQRYRDPTTALCIPPGYGVGAAAFVARKTGVIAGLPVVDLVCGAVDPTVKVERIAQDGQRVQPGDVLAHLRGAMHTILAVERTALNFVQHLSGIASLTRQYVDTVAGLPVKILDTRKTIPGWRLLAKYAVRQGGGHNHRMGLYDGILIKDNHLAYALSCERKGDQQAGTKFGIAELFRWARLESDLPIELEVDTLEQFNEILLSQPDASLLRHNLRPRPDIILLDNMTLDQLREAVRRRNAVAPEVLLEASGGVNLQTVRGIAETGVDRISVGALTHSATALDIGLDYETSR